MIEYHVIYIDELGIINSVVMEFENFTACEEWLISINAKDWEIGI